MWKHCDIRPGPLWHLIRKSFSHASEKVNQKEDFFFLLLEYLISHIVFLVAVSMDRGDSSLCKGDRMSWVLRYYYLSSFCPDWRRLQRTLRPGDWIIWPFLQDVCGIRQHALSSEGASNKQLYSHEYRQGKKYHIIEIRQGFFPFWISMCQRYVHFSSIDVNRLNYTPAFHRLWVTQWQANISRYSDGASFSRDFTRRNQLKPVCISPRKVEYFTEMDPPSLLSLTLMHHRS